MKKLIDLWKFCVKYCQKNKDFLNFLEISKKIRKLYINDRFSKYKYIKNKEYCKIQLFNTYK